MNIGNNPINLTESEGERIRFLSKSIDATYLQLAKDVLALARNAESKVDDCVDEIILIRQKAMGEEGEET